MEKRQQLELMDKIQRELQDLQNSQTAVLKKISQIEAHNITLGDDLLDEKLPDLHEAVNNSVDTISGVVEAFASHRDKFFSENNLAAELDPTS